MVTDALRARRHAQRSGRAEPSRLRERRYTLDDGAASARNRGAVGISRERVRRGWRSGRRSDSVCAGTPRRLAFVAVWAAARSRAWDRLEQLPDVDARDVRELRGGAARRPGAVGQGDPRDDPRGERGVAAGTTVDLPGRVRLSGVCAIGCAARVGPLHACGRRSAHRRGVPVHRVVVSELSLRPAVHAGHLPARAARSGRWPVGAEGGRGGVEPWRGRDDRPGRAEDGALGEVGSRVRRLESGDARAGGGWSAQRRARAARARGRPAVGGRGGSTTARRRGADRARGGREGLGRTGAAIRGARAPTPARAGAGGCERCGCAGAARDRGGRGLRLARVWVHRLAR